MPTNAVESPTLEQFKSNPEKTWRNRKFDKNSHLTKMDKHVRAGWEGTSLEPEDLNWSVKRVLANFGQKRFFWQGQIAKDYLLSNPYTRRQQSRETSIYDSQEVLSKEIRLEIRLRFYIN